MGCEHWDMAWAEHGSIIACNDCDAIIDVSSLRWISQMELPTEEEIVNWIRENENTPMGRSLVSMSKFTTHFGRIEGEFLDLIIKMSRERQIDLQCHDSWRQRKDKGEFEEGRDFIHINEWQSGLGFLNVSRSF